MPTPPSHPAPTPHPFPGQIGLMKFTGYTYCDEHSLSTFIKCVVVCCSTTQVLVIEQQLIFLRFLFLYLRELMAFSNVYASDSEKMFQLCHTYNLSHNIWQLKLFQYKFDTLSVKPNLISNIKIFIRSLYDLRKLRIFQEISGNFVKIQPSIQSPFQVQIFDPGRNNKYGLVRFCLVSLLTARYFFQDCLQKRFFFHSSSLSFTYLIL